MTDVVRMTIHENHQVHMIAINGLYSKLQKLPISTMVEPEQEMVITCKIPDLTAGEWCFHLTLHTLLYIIHTLIHTHPHSYTHTYSFPMLLPPHPSMIGRDSPTSGAPILQMTTLPSLL